MISGYIFSALKLTINIHMGYMKEEDVFKRSSTLDTTLPIDPYNWLAHVRQAGLGICNMHNAIIF